MDNFFTGEIATELIKELVRLARGTLGIRQTAKHLSKSVEALMPIIHEVRFSGSELPQARVTQLSELANNLQLAWELAQKASRLSRMNVYKSMRLAHKMEKVDRWIGKWIERQMPAHILADVHHFRVDSSVRFDRIERRIEEQERPRPQMGRGVMEMMERLGLCEGEEKVVGVGVKVGKERVKKMLLEGSGFAVGISGMAGSGKTTLAREICRDHQIRSHFNNRIFFETVSQSPNIESLKLKLWEQIGGFVVVNSSNQIPQWQMDLNPRVKPTLVVLDDMWSLAELEELVLRIPGCKTLVTSRIKFPPAIFNNTYELELLAEEEALSLFCFSAFGQWSISPDIDKKLVKQVVEECKGLPLALKVIGASLRDQPPMIWASAKNRLSRGEAISDSHASKLLERMAGSIERLPGKVRECFLDLGSFPEDKKIPLDVLINIWMERHDLDEEDAIAFLLELSNKNLLTLVKDAQNKAGDKYGSYSELSITQHDVLRDLALHMNNHDSLNRRKRMIMPSREQNLPKDWERNRDEPFEAHIISIHTSEMKESDWFLMDFPKAEVLILTFAADVYFLPPFVQTMPKLKVLVLINYGINRTILQNLTTVTTLTNLRSIWFEKTIVPPLPMTITPLQSLQKISLVLCEFRKNLKEYAADLGVIFPRLSNLTIDHCSELSELPSSICNVISLKYISISNCPDVGELPSEIGNLSSLEILRIYACPGMNELPQSICQLKRLKYLDISECLKLEDLPEELGQLTCLEKINMRGCSQLKNVPKSSVSLKSLLHVVCGEEVALAWKEAAREIPELRVQIVEECYNLNFLEE